MMLTSQSGRTVRRTPDRRTLATLGSLCLFLSAIEYIIPKPLPFMRIGLANLPLLLALDIFGARDFFLLALLKTLGQGIIGGTLFSYVFLFSLAGTFCSAALMYILRRLLGKNLGFAGLGCVGAMASNGVQLVLARYVIFGSALRYMIPPFLASGFITGIALGLICEYFCRHSRWYALHTQYAEHTRYALHTQYNQVVNTQPDTKNAAANFAGETNVVGTVGEAEYRLRRQRRWNELFNPGDLFIAGALMTLIFILSRSMSCRIAQFLFFCLLAWLSGKKNNVFITVSIMAGIVFFNLLAPYGKVLAVYGPLRITKGALFAGLEKAITLEGLVMLSRACIAGGLRLPGTIGSLLGESLRTLELMRERKGMIRRGHISAGIDALLLELEAADTGNPVYPPQPKRSIKGMVLLSAMVLITALCLFAAKF